MNETTSTSGNDSKRILVAEDNDSNYLLVKHILKAHQLTHAMNGVEAVKYMQEGAFDLILMDMKMPEMDGLEATRLIRQLHFTTPIVVVTANAFDSDRANAFEAGCNDFITKPLKKDELLAIVAKY